MGKKKAAKPKFDGWILQFFSFLVAARLPQLAVSVHEIDGWFSSVFLRTTNIQTSGYSRAVSRLLLSCEALEGSEVAPVAEEEGFNAANSGSGTLEEPADEPTEAGTGPEEPAPEPEAPAAAPEAEAGGPELAARKPERATLARRLRGKRGCLDRLTGTHFDSAFWESAASLRLGAIKRRFGVRLSEL